jgi:hypothetical protein
MIELGRYRYICKSSKMIYLFNSSAFAFNSSLVPSLLGILSGIAGPWLLVSQKYENLYSQKKLPGGLGGAKHEPWYLTTPPSLIRQPSSLGTELSVYVHM